MSNPIDYDVKINLLECSIKMDLSSVHPTGVFSEHMAELLAEYVIKEVRLWDYTSPNLMVTIEVVENSYRKAASRLKGSAHNNIAQKMVLLSAEEDFVKAQGMPSVCATVLISVEDCSRRHELYAIIIRVASQHKAKPTTELSAKKGRLWIYISLNTMTLTEAMVKNYSVKGNI